MKSCKNLFKIILFASLVCITILSGCGKKDVAPPTKPPVTPPVKTDSTVTKQDVPLGTSDGVTFFSNGDSAIFNLYAPNKKSVYIVGDFNGWQTSTKCSLINSTDGTRWWIKIGGLDPTKTYSYQYYIDSSLYVADPYSHMILDKDWDNQINIPTVIYPNIPAFPSGAKGSIVSTMQYNAPKYTWKSGSFTRPEPKNLVVYELLVRDFVATHSYKTLTDTLDYIARLGVNAIELLPVNEFEGNSSWGYNSNFMFALDKYYGTPNDYKTFIDACHAKGIAVIQDIVLEDQFGSSPLVQMYWDASNKKPAANNPWFNTDMTHPYGVGFQLNYQKDATVTFAENVFKYWLKEYHIDGFRLDQAQGYTQTNSNNNNDLWTKFDAERVQTLSTLNSYVKSIDPTAYMILESFAESAELQSLAQKGMMSWANLSFNSDQAAMSYNDAGGSWDLAGYFYNNWGFSNSIPYNLITYFESHDEVRMQFKNGQYGNSNGSYSIKNLPTGLQRDAMLATFLFSAPGPKMLWMFGERGYDDASAGPDYGNLNNTGDKRTDPQPPLWNYMQDANRAALYNLYAKMIHYKTHNSVFTTTNFSHSLNGAVKSIQLLGDDGTNVEVIGNFDVVSQTTAITFPVMGTWTDNLSGTKINVTSNPYSVKLQPGEYHLYSNVALK